MAHHWEQVNAVHFCARLGKSPAETHDLLLEAYQQDALRRVSAKDYYSRFQKKGNSFPEAYGRKSIGSPKSRSNRKEICETVVSNSVEIKSDENGPQIKIDEYGSRKSLDIKLQLQWDDDDSIDIDINSTNSPIKNFLNKIESSCNKQLKPQKLRISTNEDVQIGDVDYQSSPQKTIEPVQEVSVDSTMDDLEEILPSSSIPSQEVEEITTSPIDEIEEVTSPIHEIEETSASPIHEIEEIPASPTHEIEETSASPIHEIEDISASPIHDIEELSTSPIHETEEITASPIHEIEEIITDPNLLSDETADIASPSHEIEDITSPSYEIEETATSPKPLEPEEITSSIPPSHEDEETMECSSPLTPTTDMTPKKRRRSTPRKTRSKCKCITCRLKIDANYI